MNSPDYSIIIPVYRSVESLRPLFVGIKACMQELNKSFEVIFVDDNGSEASWNELLKLKSEFSAELKIIRLSRNFGQNAATLCGIDESTGLQIITIDDDLEIEPIEIKKLINTQKESKADVVYGKTGNQNNSWIKKLGASIIKQIFNRNQGGSSVGSSFRLIDTHVAERLRFHSQDHLFINQVISWYTLNIQFVEVKRSPRKEGSTGYSFLKLLGIGFRLIFYYTSLPLKLIVFLCALCAIASALFGSYYIYQQTGLSAESKVSLIALFGTIALLLGSLSIFGIYLNRVYTARVKKPNYSIKIKR